MAGPSNGEDDRTDVVTRVLREAAPEATVAEHQALAGLRSRLFGREGTPIMLSRYVLERRLGAGGVGVVYEAHDPELDRKVAIKLVVPRPADGVDPSEAQARLLREAQSLARLSHPNVVPVHDVGSYAGSELDLPADERSNADNDPGGRGVFIVMELVEGQTLREWLAGADRSWREVLGAFVEAGRGLAAAHAEGLVHRDFKPANVMVGKEGRVRVLDFGLARAQGEDMADASSPEPGAGSADPDRTPNPSWQTRTGAVMGTPAYMAPEQHRGEAVDARTDQFAFCVALFEGLYGARPFAGKDMAALVKAKSSSEIRVPAVASVPARVHAAVARGLAADPDRRFASMDALLTELERDPAARRRRRVVTAVAGLSVVAAATLGGIAWKQHRTGACLGQDRLLIGVWDDDLKSRVQAAFTATKLPYARHAWTSVERALDEYAERWVETRTGACEATLVRREVPRETMDAVDMCLDGRLRALGELSSLLAEADVGVVQNAVATAARLPDLEACSQEKRAPLDPAQREQLLAIEGHLARATSLRAAGRYEHARTAVGQALAGARASGNQPALARALLTAGEIEIHAERQAEAEELLFQAVEVAEECDEPRVATRALITLVWTVTIQQTRAGEAERFARLAAVKLRTHAFGPDLESDYELYVGRMRMTQGRYLDAIEAITRALTLRTEADGGEERRTSPIYTSLAIAEFRAGQRDRAREHFRRALEIDRAALGDEHPTVAKSLANLAATPSAEGPAAALRMNREALRIREASLRPTHPAIGSSHQNIANDLENLGRLDEALEHLREAGRIFTAEDGPETTDMTWVHAGLSRVLYRLGRHEEALAEARRSVAIGEAAFGPDHARLAEALVVLGRAHHGVGDHVAAIETFERTVARIETAFDDRHPSLADPLHGLGEALVVSGARDRGIEALERAVEVAGADGADDPVQLATTRFALARALLPTDPGRARELASLARAALPDGPPGDHDRGEIDAWLEKHADAG